MMLIAGDVYNSSTFISTSTHNWSGKQLSMMNTVNARYQMNSTNASYWVLGLRRKGS